MYSSPINEQNLFLFHEGTNYRAYQILGAHLWREDGLRGVRFAVWAPHAVSVAVVGNFNHWQGDEHRMTRSDNGEVWTLFVPDLGEGEVYKYEIITESGQRLLKSDPYGFYAEVRPQTASVVYNLDGYEWQDEAWQSTRQEECVYEKPMLIYEMHLGSWRLDADGKPMTYRQIADQLVEYLKEMSYTHLELMPITEYPFDGSWGYQTTGYFAVTSRFGEPKDFMYLVDLCHQNGIGVIVDWVPGHFCRDDHGLRLFDGKNLYESDNPMLADNRGWGTLNFDYGRTEVRSFLISSAMFFFEVYHIDGLRIDGVANMLYLNYGREEGEWLPNKFGGDGNLEAVELLQKLNETVFYEYPHALMMAEESTSWPMITKPVYMGGLGFNFKWNMGWMNDMLKYVEEDPVHRKYHHNLLTFSLMYAFSENFILPLSHDEVVHGKRSLLDKMPGDYWKKFANLRVFYAYWMAHPGKKLLFMGGEFGQFIEWKYYDSLDWHILTYPKHKEIQRYTKALNRLYVDHPAFWENDCSWDGFSWLDCNDSAHSIVAFMRMGKKTTDRLVVICNFTPVVRHDYRIGVPAGKYREIFNSDAPEFGGSGIINYGIRETEKIVSNGQEESLSLLLPPLGAVILEPIAEEEPLLTRVQEKAVLK